MISISTNTLSTIMREKQLIRLKSKNLLNLPTRSSALFAIQETQLQATISATLRQNKISGWSSMIV